MKTFVGKVISDKMNKTVVVSVEHTHMHPLYRKILVKKSKMHVRNEAGAKTGDKVEIVEVRPFSRTVSHIVSKILVKAK